MIRDYQAIGRTCFLKGQQKIIPTYGKHQGVKLIGTLDYETLPPYSPNLNLIEEFWGWLKRSCVYNVFYSSVQEIRTRVQTFVKEVNKKSAEVIDRLCTVM